MIKALRWAVRDLRDSCPDDYTYPCFDIVVHCDDGKIRHSEAFLDHRDEAEVLMAKYEILGYEEEEGPLEQWEVTLVSEKG